MGFNIIKASKDISKKYKRYLKTIFDIEDKDYKKIFEEKLEKQTFEKGPYLDVVNSFEKGHSIAELIDEGLLSPDFVHIDKLYKIPSLYKHQESAIRKVLNNQNVIISTGTGSGKTESFMIPIINSLMEEKSKKGTISDGVRTILIFPMNALANDQLDRLRKLLKNYPDITFGSYTGQTPKFENKKGKYNDSGKSLYEKLNGNREDDLDLRKPLINERLSRETMKEHPPHILITNYAMLEYLMIRPEDSIFFSNDMSKLWKYIVLDEAHTYSGSTGIEVSMLIRRLLAKLNNPNIQFILTSATLGDEDSNDQVVKFASDLCSKEFKKENIIRASRKTFSPDKEELTNLDLGFYKYVSSNLDNPELDTIQNIKELYEINEDSNSTNLSEFLYEILINDNTFWKVKKYMNNVPKQVQDLCNYMNWTENDVSDFVNVASIAEKNGFKLFDARYHMFLKATEGVFITLAPHKDLFLKRETMVYDGKKQYKVFEVATCVSCHKLYILGKIEHINGHMFLEQKSSVDSDSISEAFMIGNHIENEDSDDLLEDDNLEYTEYKLCPHCGMLIEKDLVSPDTCGHPISEFIDVIRVNNIKEDGRVTKCINCGAKRPISVLRGLFTGQEAATSVIGTALFEELPSYKLIKEKVNNTAIDEDDIFASNESDEIKTRKVPQAKQFIAFSDNRQAAAYYASYLTLSYNEILYRRILNEVLFSMNNNITPIDIVADALANKLKDYNIVIPFDNESSETSKGFNYIKLAWIILLKELVDSNQKNSLIGLGMCGLELDSNLFQANPCFTKEEVQTMCTYFALGMIVDGSIDNVSINLTQKDRELYIYNGKETRYAEISNNSGIKGFLPKNKFTNKRYNYLEKIVNQSDILKARWKQNPEFINKLLSSMWSSLFIGKSIGISKTNKVGVMIDVGKINFVKDRKWYICPKCHKITQFNVRGVCPTYKCDGKLIEYNPKEHLTDNHYYRMYNDLEPRSLRVVEHTAQLNKEKAYDYQNLFKNKKIDVLSCSTTFEMGVDVGELETVFMRNMPPTPANYTQRAGRAGRSSKSAAFALTFCNKSNHDFNYFEDPRKMISGSIKPPQFNVENEKIAIRHLYSSVMSFFFNKYSIYFDTAESMMEKNNETGLSGYELLKQYLFTKPEDLKQYLKRSLPVKLVNKFGVEDFKWVDYLFDKPIENYPNLRKVKEVYDEEIEILNSEIDKAKNDDNAGSGYLVENLKKRRNNYRNEGIISFLSRNNILPRYGFPVDSVELKINEENLNGLQLSRDLSMAISEYAPGCQIVAMNKLITSRYIKQQPNKDFKMYDYVECDNCNTLNVHLHVDVPKGEEHPLCTCEQCGKKLDRRRIKTFIVPEFGFIAENKSSIPTLVKPERTFRTEASFVSYSNPDGIIKSDYNIGDIDVSIEQMQNDGEMAILNTQEFLICPECGYAIEAPSDDYSGNFKKAHKNSRGMDCHCKEGKRLSFGYKYKTDVVRIKIDKNLILSEGKEHDIAYTILQALILSAAETLNIEYTEISGCLQYYNGASGPNYAYILYDRTPGGAGHVRRINNEMTLQKILENAYNRCKKCTCGKDTSCYNCLRTYQNQKYHDILKRKYVIEYLADFVSGIKDDSTESKLENLFLNWIKNKANKVIIKGNSKKIYHLLFNNCEWILEPQVDLDYKDNVIKHSRPDFVLTPKSNKLKKIAIFTDGYQFHNDIVDDDTLKRDAILYSKDFRVFSIGYKDVVHNYKEIYSSLTLNDIDEFKNLNSNILDLLYYYLSNDDAELNLNRIANSYANKLIDKNISNDEEYLNSVKSRIEELNDFANFDYIDSLNNLYGIFKTNVVSNFNSLIAYSQNKFYVYSILNDTNQTDKNYIEDWYGFNQFNNLMQFSDNFIMLSRKGLDHDIYRELMNVESIDYDLGNWKQLIDNMTNKESINFARECAKKKLPLAIEPDDLDDGSMAELEWPDKHIVYLNQSQLKYIDSFKNEGYIVVTNINELIKELGDDHNE